MKEKPQEFCPELEWFLGCGAAVHGERSAMGGQIARLQGASPGNHDGESYSDQQLGFGRCSGSGSVDRARVCQAAWILLDPDIRGVLESCYCQSHPWATPAVREKFGPRAVLAVILAANGTEGSPTEIALASVAKITDACQRESNVAHQLWWVALGQAREEQWNNRKRGRRSA